MKYTVIMFPSKQLQDKANSYRKRYDPNYALIPPHIKLATPFEAEESDLEGITEKLHHIASNHSPIEIQVYKVKTFHPVNNVIYFAVRKTDPLYDLHVKINNEKSKINDAHRFVPHITIGQDLSDQEHSDVIGRMAMMNINHTEAIDRFHLMYQLENGVWTTYETFQLGKE